jgi:hypothetical protein
VWAAEHYRRLTKRLEDEQKFRELAVEELAHRLKNKVATIQSIVSLRLREDPQARDEIVSCLGSLRVTDDLIIAAQGKGARIGVWIILLLIWGDWAQPKIELAMQGLPFWAGRWNYFMGSELHVLETRDGPDHCRLR